MTEIIEWKTFENKEKGIVRNGVDHLIIRNVEIWNCRTGLDIRACGKVELHNVIVKPGPRTYTKWGRGMLLGYPGKPETAVGDVLIEDCVFYNIGAASGDYGKYNRDILNYETPLPGSILTVRRSVLGGATDANLDAKRNTVTVLDEVFLGASHFQLRAWPRSGSNAAARIYHRGLRWANNPGHKQTWTGNEPIDDADRGVIQAFRTDQELEALLAA